MFDIHRTIDNTEELFVKAGVAKAQAEALDERRKRVRAALFVKYRGDGKGSAESTEFALADPVYEAACTERDIAAFDAEELRAKAEAKRMHFEAWRTEQSTERAKMNLR